MNDTVELSGDAISASPSAMAAVACAKTVMALATGARRVELLAGALTFGAGRDRAPPHARAASARAVGLTAADAVMPRRRFDRRRSGAVNAG